ncbi:MAG: DUF354 domain-containing protein [Bacteroidales bacterium]|nr:DUF354 domain-containing protein [Bacteroidales bacterium]
MRILFDIGHPAHVHLFKHAIWHLKRTGHIVLVTVKDIPLAKQLMDVYGIEYLDLGVKKDSFWGKGLYQLKYNLSLYNLVRRNKIQYGISSSITLPHVSRVTSLTSIVMDDDDDSIEPLFVTFGHAFSDSVLSPDSIKRKTKHCTYYAGQHELAYLHPNYFTPDPDVIKEIGLSQSDKFFVLRFVALKGHHDIGQSGISFDQKLRLVELLKPHGRIFITAERELDPEFEQYRLPITPEKIHSLLYYATMFLGDSQTMTSEAAILGTPSLKCNSFAGKLSVPNELESKYSLCFSYHPSDFEKFYKHIEELLTKPNLKHEWQHKRASFLADKIDVTAFLVWFVENYPDSRKIMKETPEYQERFREMTSDK